MIKSSVGHLQYNIDLKNVGFYRDLLTFLGWKVIYDDPNVLGIEGENKVSLWFAKATKGMNNDYDANGANHIGISVPHQADVDDTVAYLKEHGIQGLFETPRHRPEFCGSTEETYYQVMFESPDRILFEVVYTGPKDK